MRLDKARNWLSALRINTNNYNLLVLGYSRLFHCMMSQGLFRDLACFYDKMVHCTNYYIHYVRADIYGNCRDTSHFNLLNFLCVTQDESPNPNSVGHADPNPNPNPNVQTRTRTRTRQPLRKPDPNPIGFGSGSGSGPERTPLLSMSSSPEKLAIFFNAFIFIVVVNRPR